MAHSPPISPTVATPLAHRKRRHSAIDRNSIDLTGDGNAAPEVKHAISPNKALAPVITSPPVNGSSATETVRRKLEDDDDIDEDDREMLEDILDTAELEPYQSGFIEGEEALDKHTIARIRSRLLRMGPERFIHETLQVSKISPSLLGQAFGINPMFAEQLGDDIFVKVLEAAIVRAYFKRRKLTEYNTIDDAADLLRKSSNIMVITGAGISTSLGIPDFRSKGTGFYSKLVAKGFSEPEEVFDIYTFDEDPKIFYELAADIIPDLKRYSPTHGFIRLLQDEGKLQTNYTQNIDNLEELAGIEKCRLIQCHGSFATATCRKCKYKVKGTDIFPDIRAKKVAYCKRCISNIAAQESQPKPKKRKPTPARHNFSDSDEDEDDDIPTPGVMKPDITFFGEQLPDDFFTRFTDEDVHSVDLVIVMGTSLKVAPVSDMPNYLPHHLPHIYISREPVQHVEFDVQLLGNCDDVVVELARRAGWGFRHEMVDEDVKLEVSGVEGKKHWWVVAKEEAKEYANDSGLVSPEKRIDGKAGALLSPEKKTNGGAGRLMSPGRKANGSASPAPATNGGS